MQNKGLIRVFAIVFALVSIYQLTYTFITNKIEGDAQQYAERKVDATENGANRKEQELVKGYLDSVSSKSVWGFTDYQSAKEHELRKGLDLKGGINVILQISVKDLLIGMADGSDDVNFRQALAAADERIKDGQQDYLEYFLEEYTAIDGAQLASPDVFAHRDMEGFIEDDMTNGEVEPLLRERLQESITSAFQVLRKRIDKFGTTQPNIQQLGSSGRILIELPGAKDIASIQQALTTTAELQFWHVVAGDKIVPYLETANEYWKNKLAAQNTTDQVADDAVSTADIDNADTTDGDDDTTEATDDALDNLLNNDDPADVDEDTEVAATGNDENPIFSRLVGVGSGFGFATFKAGEREQVLEYLNDPQVRSNLAPELRNVKFIFGKPELNSKLGFEIVELYAIDSNREGVPPLGGSVITDAQQDYDQFGKVVVAMSMDGEGSKIWETMTTRSFQERSQLAVVLDNTVYSAPVASTTISGGSTQITGQFDIKEADDLANVLRAGKLPARAEIIQSEVVGPSLGQEAIDSGLWSFGIALLIVLLWMIFYYGRAGFYADIALVINILFIFGALAAFNTVLTLPGIAGIVLTIGISVDANVLIFERIREELAKGKSQADSIKDGFNNALSSILDANVTTFLTAAILFIFGTGPIQGFAVTLMIGILTSLFTAIFITRLFIDGYGKNGKSLAFSTPITKNWFRNVNIDFLSKRKVAYTISGVLVIASFISLFTVGLNQGIDFAGGRTYTVRFAQDVNATDVSKALSSPEVFNSAEAKTYGGDNQLKISTKYRINDSGVEVNKDIETKLYNTLKPYLGADITQEQFADVSIDDKQYGVMSNFQVGPTIADDILTGSIYAIIGSLIVVFLYILIRFRRWQFSMGAVAAVFHDVLIVLGIFSATYSFLPFSMEIDQAFIAAILTVIGYSLNDTVVVFDRIREFINERTNWDFPRTVNAAISSTISRTLNTSLTTLIVLLSIFIFGGESIRGFMFALIIGVVVGTYSSVFIATPIMYDGMRSSKATLEPTKKEEEEK